MTKSTKRKKERASDFTKRKLKLGKGKQPATNAIDTSFKSRSIALPQQTITITKETSTPTTKRKLTLDALLAHLKHYGAGVRKDALQGLHELLNEHRVLIEQNLSKLVNGCIRLISDEDASVRKALHSFLAWLLPRIPREHLVPYAPNLLLFTASAQSHIFPEIRIDAIRVLDLLLEFIPEQVAAGFSSNGSVGNQGGHGRKVLDGYLGLLNVGTRFSEDASKAAGPSHGTGGQSMTLVTLSATSKASVLRSFSKFLLHAAEQAPRITSAVNRRPEESVPLWYLSPTFGSHDAFASFVDILSLQRSVRPLQRQARFWVSSEGFEADDDDFTGRFPLSDAFDNSGAAESLLDLENVLTEIDHLAREERSPDELNPSIGPLLASLCRTVGPVLVSTFLDCAPSVFSPTQASPEAELELIHSLMEIARCLCGRLLRDTGTAWDQKEAAREDLKTLIGHMSAYFPFGEDRMIAQDMKSENTFQQMNLIYCELFSLQSLNFASSLDSREESCGPTAKRQKLNHPQAKKAKATARSGTGTAKQAERVREYVVRCLCGTTGLGLSATTHPLGQSLTAQAYVALLPTLWWLLNHQGDQDHSSEVFGAVLQHATKVGSLNGVKLAATDFVGRLVLLQSEHSYRGSLRIGCFTSDDLQRALRDWLSHLPKVLWELGDKNPAATELILLFMLRLTQRRSWLNDVETSTVLCMRFAPFFTMQHATHGELRGPYARLNKYPVEAEVSSAASEPNNAGQRSVPAPMKRLALDVAALMVSTTRSTGQAHPSAPRRIPPRAGRRAGDDGRSIGLGSDPVSARGFSASVVDARAGLRRAVDKAVSGTVEEAYWLGVSQI